MQGFEFSQLLGLNVPPLESDEAHHKKEMTAQTIWYKIFDRQVDLFCVME